MLHQRNGITRWFGIINWVDNITWIGEWLFKGLSQRVNTQNVSFELLNSGQFTLSMYLILQKLLRFKRCLILDPGHPSIRGELRVSLFIPITSRTHLCGFHLFTGSSIVNSEFFSANRTHENYLVYVHCYI